MAKTTTTYNPKKKTGQPNMGINPPAAKKPDMGINPPKQQPQMGIPTPVNGGNSPVKTIGNEKGKLIGGNPGTPGKITYGPAKPGQPEMGINPPKPPEQRRGIPTPVDDTEPDPTLEKMPQLRDDHKVGISPIEEGNTPDPNKGKNPDRQIGISPIENISYPANPGTGGTNPPQPQYDSFNMPGLSEGTRNMLNQYVQNGYQPSPNTQAALEQLNQMAQNQPGAYQDAYKQQMDALMNNIMNREAFSYDVTSDPVYQAMREQYMTGGQQAMMDTMGQAAAMTGGYGSSYASTAGNQAYQQYLTKLNESIPELYDRARQAYDAEADRMMQQYNMLAAADDRDYGRWNDQYNRWTNERNYLNDQYRDERNFDYSQWGDQRDYWTDVADRENQQYNTDRNFNFQQDQFRYNQDQDALDRDWQRQQFEYQQGLDRWNQDWQQNQFDYQKSLDEWNQQWQRDQFDYQREQDQLDRDWQREQFDYDRAQNDKKYAYETVMSMLQLGKMPSLEQLELAGISKDDAKKIKEYYKNKNGSKSSSGDKKKSGDKDKKGDDKKDKDSDDKKKDNGSLPPANDGDNGGGEIPPDWYRKYYM